MFDVVGIPAIQCMRWNSIINLIPFHDYNESGYLFQIVMNAIMFMPFGFMVPIIWDDFKSFPRTVVAGVITSVIIEIAQLFSARVTDIDDLLMNTLGCICGFIVIWIFKRRKWKTINRKTEEDSKKDLLEFVITNIIILLVVIFIRGYVAEFIYTLPIFK